MLKKCKGRIVNIDSVLPKCRFTEVDCENLKAEKSFDFSRFYESKVALMIFTKELAKRTFNSGFNDDNIFFSYKIVILLKFK